VLSQVLGNGSQAGSPAIVAARGSISRLINSPKFWRNNLPRRWIKPVRTASCLTPPGARGRVLSGGRVNPSATGGRAFIALKNLQNSHICYARM
jgi:hypothetical protein